MKISPLIIATALMTAACNTTTVFQNELPPVWPDYIDVTIPADIAPLNFNLPDNYSRVFVKVAGDNGQTIKTKGRYARFNAKRWRTLTRNNSGGCLTFTVLGRQDGVWRQFRDFTVKVSIYPLDDYGVVYRKIAPGYETYSKIGNYQRDIHSFREDPIIESTLTPGQCVNCHTANATDPAQFTFHLRGRHGATYFQTGDSHKWMTTKTDRTISNAVYPYWHPSGDYCACSNNSIHQNFWVSPDRLIEVYDTASDLSVVDVRTDEVIVSDLVHTDWLETYPAFSPDGGTLYYCTSYPYEAPKDAEKIRYNLCSINFDAEKGQFGTQVDTLVNAEVLGKSITFPRPSYDGRWLLYTLADFGCFPIDHEEADLWLMDLETGDSHSLDMANSQYAESFHNWSSNSHWILFSSRREDGLYSNLYIAEIDGDGNAAKPFLLPQRNPRKYYSETLYSFNVPDFTKTKVKFDTYGVYREVIGDERVTAKSK